MMLYLCVGTPIPGESSTALATANFSTAGAWSLGRRGWEAGGGIETHHGYLTTTRTMLMTRALEARGG